MKEHLGENGRLQPREGLTAFAHLVGPEDGWDLAWARDEDEYATSGLRQEIPWPFDEEFIAYPADMERAGFVVIL